MSVLEIILAIFIPPLAVALRFGLSSAFWINLLLTLLGGLPGIIHAFYVLTKK
ncbi:YqaE/Pmp3 family membrane protein [Abyssalbus ytuae]|uniref:YqaE/Pmp3 family membrane protein n=1 Tax=Abyssalbus ytuae TaxID=2926907 RepID=A0A9E6ZNH0_9FLAO|nr:YqaE/Pmp3 family membrane protein [Abyssalbus ytuae]UOB17600.1 YqaE/Pmp3 family membrane protein [Abyssalbus ytuae]